MTLTKTNNKTKTWKTYTAKIDEKNIKKLNDFNLTFSNLPTKTKH